MITHKMKSLAVDLQGALGGKDGLAINEGMIALCVELGGSERVLRQLVTPISQTVYMMTLVIQHIPTLSLAAGPSLPHDPTAG